MCGYYYIVVLEMELQAGATPEEVRHAVIVLTSTIGFPTVAAALAWLDDMLAAADSR